MSTMFGHYMDNFEDVEMVDPLQELQRDLEDMDLPSNLNYENSGLMSSEFFDSVLSMEQCNFRNELDKEPIRGADSDFGFSDPDDTHFNGNASPDSVNSSIDFEIKGFDVEDKEPNELAVQFLSQPKQEIKSIASTVQIPTKVYISNSNGKKVIVKPFTNKNNKKNIINPKQILRVQSISGGGRSVLLPFNVTKMKNIKIINGKELQAENLKITKITDITSKKTNTVTINKSYADDYEVSSPETFDDDSDSIDTKLDHEQQYPLLVLSDDEKRLLNKEGITLPSHYPLTKQQERELKRIRRKIRNKISAQDSRKRKKEYVDGLEERLKQGAEEKKILMNRVKHLQQQNNRLIAQMNKIQALVFNTSGTKATPTTCLLIVLVSILLVSLPNLRVHQNSELMDQQQSASRRALLSSQQATNEDLNLDEFLLFNKEEESEFPSVFDEDNNTGDVSVSKYIHNYNLENIGMNGAKMIQAQDFEKDVKGTFETIRKYLQESDSLRFDYDSYGKQNPKHHSEKKFIEPDIDDFPHMNGDPPAKRIKTYDQNEIVSNNYIPISNSASNVVSATVSVNSSKKE